jgi:thymidylate synthase
MHAAYDSVEAAWRDRLTLVASQGAQCQGTNNSSSIGSHFGVSIRNTREVIAGNFVVTNPRDRLIWSRARKPRLGFAIANFLWMLSGTVQVDLLAFYNPRARRFADGHSRSLAAPGPRIFGEHGSPLSHVIKRLTEDRYSRRALLPLYYLNDLTDDSSDCPCFGSLHFLVRDERLTLIVNMRSQSMLMVFPYDSFALSLIQECVSLELGLEPGPLYYSSNSEHIYDDESSILEQVLQERSISERSSMPPMDRSPLADSTAILEAEEHIRTQLSRKVYVEISLQRFKLSPFWQMLMYGLIVATRLELGHSPSSGELSEAHLLGHCAAFSASSKEPSAI